MLKRRSTWLGGTGGLLLVLSLSGVVAGAAALTAVVEPAPEVVEPGEPADTTATFEDLNGDGIDDDCQEDEVADPVAAEAADTAVDADADGVISTTEAAHSNRIGGKNCNHGGYVSWIAQAADGADTDAEAAKKDKDAARAVKAALRAERALARAAAKAERALARETKRSERAAAHDARKAERGAAKAAKQADRHAARAAKQKGH